MSRTPLARRVAALLGVTAAVVLTASPAAATDPSGSITPSPAPPPSATLGTPVLSFSDGIGVALPQDAVVRDFSLTYGPHSSSGWHQHPGVVIATVVSGTVERKVPCRRKETFGPGQAFVEVGPHRVRNVTDTDAVLSITQIAPAGTTGSAFREDLPTPTCPPRRS